MATPGLVSVPHKLLPMLEWIAGACRNASCNADDGLDGINNRIDPGSPIDKNLYDLPPAEAKEVKSTPGSLDQALDALERDHKFLLRGDVFTADVIETWLDYKRKKEVDAIRLRPHPYEFHLYYDI